jgi:hypothetical protein
MALPRPQYGQVQGNDVKFYYRFADRLPQMNTLNNLAEAPDLPSCPPA